MTFPSEVRYFMFRWSKRSILYATSTILMLGTTSELVARQAQQPPPIEPSGEVTAIHAGWLLDRLGEPARLNSTVIVVGTKIEEIVDGFVVPDGARVVDLADEFVLPGLIDVHVHLTMEASSPVELQVATKETAQFALEGTVFARRTIQAGFTTVRDLASPSGVALRLRDSIEAGMIDGPTIIAAGPMISSTGGIPIFAP